MLAWTIYISFLDVLVLMLRPERQSAGGALARSAQLTLQVRNTITYP